MRQCLRRSSRRVVVQGRSQDDYTVCARLPMVPDLRASGLPQSTCTNRIDMVFYTFALLNPKLFVRVLPSRSCWLRWAGNPPPLVLKAKKMMHLQQQPPPVPVSPNFLDLSSSPRPDGNAAACAWSICLEARKVCHDMALHRKGIRCS